MLRLRAAWHSRFYPVIGSAQFEWHETDDGSGEPMDTGRCGRAPSTLQRGAARAAI